MDEKDNAQLLGESSLEVDQPPPWPVKVRPPFVSIV